MLIIIQEVRQTFYLTAQNQHLKQQITETQLQKEQARKQLLEIQARLKQN